MKKIQIQKLSDIQRRKLIKGLPVRVKKPIRGKGVFTILVDPFKYNIMSKTFDKEKGFQVNLTEDELIANAEAQLADDIIEGEGIFGKKFDRWLKKKGLMKYVDKIGKAIKKPLFKAMDIGTKIGKEALIKSKYGVAAVPLLEYSNKVAQSYIDKPSDFQKNYKKKLLKHAGDTGVQMVEDIADVAMEGLTKSEKEDIKGEGLYIGGKVCGKGIYKFNGTHKFGDKPGWVNPNFMLRTQIYAPYYSLKT